MPAAKPYHHGNLKEALLDAAIELIAAAGLRSFTLREVARRAGVSHNAPYRHFRDREDLLAAVATEGFERLTRAMAGGSRRSSPKNRLRRCGLAYVNFALSWPQHFAAMFDSPWNEQDYPACAAAGKRSFETLLGFVRECQTAKQMPAGDPLKIAYLAWSLVHGIAKLANAGQFPWRSKAEVLRFCAFSIQSEGRFGKTL